MNSDHRQPITASLLRVLRTLRPLRWEQIAYRPVRVAQFRAYRYWPSLAAWQGSGAAEIPAERAEIFRRAIEESFTHWRRDLPAAWIDGRFTFLNRSLALPVVDWARRYESHLWNYHLHYFNETVPAALAEDDRAWPRCRALIEDWIAKTRPGRGDGWDAYPLSLRVVNWLYAYALVAPRESDAAFLARWRRSLHGQLGFLRRHLEFHLQANHLLKNVKALVVGGLAFDDPTWLAEGERLLQREFAEQVLPDGGHYERAPMYHAQTFADFLECAALLRAFDRPLFAGFEAGLERMASFLSAVTHADGSLALFNDSANTEETRPRPILDAARRILPNRQPATDPRPAFPRTGYYVWSNEADKIVIDAGPPAVAYNTAHAHCDMLSYELWLDGQPFLVDSGLHGYGGDPFREYCRSTPAHNTVLFDGVEQSECWGTFRMARRAEFLGATWQADAQGFDFQGSYRRYDGRLVHERRIVRDADGRWTVTDRAREGEASRAASFLHFHPDVAVQKIKTFLIECRIRRRIVFIELIADDGIEIDMELVQGGQSPMQGWYFPEFGASRASAVACISYAGVGRAGFGYRFAERVSEARP